MHCSVPFGRDHRTRYAALGSGPMKLLLALGCNLLALITPTVGLADDFNTCRALKEQRDAVASDAMRAEISLASRYRQQHCPELNRQAEQANANSQGVVPIDAQVLLQCRQAAEQHLERENPVLYRNRLGFTFYSPAGSSAARRADQLLEQLDQQGCGR